jgi:ribokinase
MARAGSVKIEKIVDTTGAGDTFLGYFLAELFAEDYDGSWNELKRVKKAVEVGTVAASCAIQELGAMSSIPKREVVVEAMKKHEQIQSSNIVL